jgi:hypothetical protein
MLSRFILVAGAVVMLSTAAVQAHAQDRDEMMYRLHHACDAGDRRACVRFGIAIGENHERHEEWRRVHPEYFWWEH